MPETKKIIIFCVPFAILLLGVVTWLFLRKTLRTRHRVSRQLRADPDINEWLVLFSWSRKILYMPTVFASLIACALMTLRNIEVWPSLDAGLIGGVWLAVFFVNFLVDEYEISIKMLLIGVLCILALFLWLSLLDWVWPFLRLFRHLKVEIGAMGYGLLAIVFSVAIVISWIRGLFYYVAVTPNYMNIQTGPTETGEQIARERYSTRVDTGDFLERMFGFGRIMITFTDQRRQPMMLLVSRIGKTAARLESIRGKLSVDKYQAAREDPQPSP